MEIQEIYETLRQITFAKGQILEQVAYEKQFQIQKYIQQIKSTVQSEPQLPIPNVSVKQKPLNREQESMQGLIQALKILRREQKQIRDSKIQREQQRYNLLLKRKQQDIRLESIKSNEQHPSHRKQKPQQNAFKKQQVIQFQKVEKLSQQLQQLQQQFSIKQNQLTKLTQQTQINQQNLQKVFIEYQDITNTLSIKQLVILPLKSKLRDLQHRLTKLSVENSKLKQNQNQTVGIGMHVDRTILGKIAAQEQIHKRILQVYEGRLISQSKYLNTLVKIKQKLTN